MSRVSAMASDARPYLATEGAANSGCLFASRATTQMSAIAPKPEGTGLSCQLRGRSAVAPLARGACHGRRVASRISSRKASVAATRGLFRGSLSGNAGEGRRAMDEKVHEQVANVAALPGIVKASFAMPDAHWGYGFPIGGVAAFDPDQNGIVSAGGVGFDISCGVRTLLTGLKVADV